MKINKGGFLILTCLSYLVGELFHPPSPPIKAVTKSEVKMERATVPSATKVNQ